MIQKSPMGGGVNNLVNSKSYLTCKLLKISIFILPIFCFFFEKDCYSFDKEKVQELYNRFKNQLENNENLEYYNTFRYSRAYDMCISLSFDSDDNAEIKQNKDKLYECLKNFEAHAKEHLQSDFSRDIEDELDKAQIYGNNFRCTKYERITYWCKSDEYKCYLMYYPKKKFSLEGEKCSPISKEHEPKWYKVNGEYTYTEIEDYLNEKRYSTNSSCIDTGDQHWICLSGGNICNVHIEDYFADHYRRNLSKQPVHECKPY